MACGCPVAAVERDLAPGGVRRRGRALRPAVSRGHGPRDRGRARRLLSRTSSAAWRAPGCTAGKRPPGRTRTSTDASPRRMSRYVGRANAAKRLAPLEGTPGRAIYADGEARLETEEETLVVTAALPAPSRGEVRRRPRRAAARRDRRDHVAGAVLVRLGGYAVGVFDGERLVASKVGQRLVHGRHRAGGSSANRFRRRREEQARALLDRRGRGREPRPRAVPRPARGGRPGRRPHGGPADDRAAPRARVARRRSRSSASSPCPTRVRPSSSGFLRPLRGRDRRTARALSSGCRTYPDAAEAGWKGSTGPAAVPVLLRLGESNRVSCQSQRRDSTQGTCRSKSPRNSTGLSCAIVVKGSSPSTARTRVARRRSSSCALSTT